MGSVSYEMPRTYGRGAVLHLFNDDSKQLQHTLLFERFTSPQLHRLDGGSIDYTGLDVLKNKKRRCAANV